MEFISSSFGQMRQVQFRSWRKATRLSFKMTTSSKTFISKIDIYFTFESKGLYCQLVFNLTSGFLSKKKAMHFYCLNTSGKYQTNERIEFWMTTSRQVLFFHNCVSFQSNNDLRKVCKINFYYSDKSILLVAYQYNKGGEKLIWRWKFQGKE